MTICQVRDAANVMLDALTLSPQDQTSRLTKAARIIRDTQAKNAKARACHANARQKQLRLLKVRVETLRCCIPPPSG